MVKTKRHIIRLLTLLLLLCAAVNQVWAATVTYHILTLPMKRTETVPDENGNYEDLTGYYQYNGTITHFGAMTNNIAWAVEAGFTVNIDKKTGNLACRQAGINASVAWRVSSSTELCGPADFFCIFTA